MSLVVIPHDKYFRDTMADTDTTLYFLKEYMPPSLINKFHLDKLKNVTDYYFDETYKEYFTDLVFRVPMIDGPMGYICILFEHKSYLDSKAPLQVLGYMAQIWQKSMENKRKPSAILPILFYHGQEDWTIGSSLGELFYELPSWMLCYFPEFKYHLFDTRLFEEEIEKLPENPRFGAFIRLLLASRMQAKRNRHIGEALQLANTVSRLYFERSIIYLLPTHDIDANELLMIILLLCLPKEEYGHDVSGAV